MGSGSTSRTATSISGATSCSLSLRTTIVRYTYQVASGELGSAPTASVVSPPGGRALDRAPDPAARTVGPPPDLVLAGPWSAEPVTPDGPALTRVVAWMAAPHVAGFWRQDWPAAAWADEVRRQRAGDPLASVARGARRRAGGLRRDLPRRPRRHRAAPSGRPARPGRPPGDRRPRTGSGRGLGRGLLAAAADALLAADPACGRVLGDPEATHVVARRAFAAAGFVRRVRGRPAPQAGRPHGPRPAGPGPQGSRRDRPPRRAGRGHGLRLGRRRPRGRHRRPQARRRPRPRRRAGRGGRRRPRPRRRAGRPERALRAGGRGRGRRGRRRGHRQRVAAGAGRGGAHLHRHLRHPHRARQLLLGAARPRPSLFPHMLHTSIGSILAQRHGWTGPNLVVNAACSSGNVALSLAAAVAGGRPGHRRGRGRGRVLRDRPDRHGVPAHAGAARRRPAGQRLPAVPGGQPRLLPRRGRRGHGRHRPRPTRPGPPSWGAPPPTTRTTWWRPSPRARQLERCLPRRAGGRRRRPRRDVGVVKAHGSGTPLNDGVEAALADRLFPATTRLCSYKPLVGPLHGRRRPGRAGRPAGRATGWAPCPPTSPTIPPTRACADGGPPPDGLVLCASVGLGGANSAVVLAVDWATRPASARRHDHRRPGGPP